MLWSSWPIDGLCILRFLQDEMPVRQSLKISSKDNWVNLSATLQSFSACVNNSNCRRQSNSSINACDSRQSGLHFDEKLQKNTCAHHLFNLQPGGSSDFLQHLSRLPISIRFWPSRSQ